MKVSVVMCTYNGERYLEQQIQSILGQTLQPDEFIVCDDCSTDGTVAILERYQQEGKLTYQINAQQLGLINNFKKAVSWSAAGNHVALSDQDDIWMTDKLEKSVALLQTMNQTLPCFVHSDLILVDEQEKVLNNSFRNELGQDKFQHNLESLLFGNFVTGCTVVMNAELKTYFETIPQGIKYHDGWLALAAFTFGQVAEITEPLIRYRKHGSNLSIAAGTKPRNRYQSVVDQLIKAIKGKDDFLLLQLETAERFYTSYQAQMSIEKKAHYQRFLALSGKSYLSKKLAFGKMARNFAKV